MVAMVEGTIDCPSAAGGMDGRKSDQTLLELAAEVEHAANR